MRNAKIVDSWWAVALATLMLAAAVPRATTSAAPSVTTITLPEPASTPDSAVFNAGLLYVDEGYSNGDAVSVISVDNDTILKTIPIPNTYFPEPMSLDANEGYLYVPSNCTAAPPSFSVCSGYGEVSIIDTHTMQLVGNITLNSPTSSAYDPVSDQLYVMNGQSQYLPENNFQDTLDIINAGTHQLVKSVQESFDSGPMAINYDTDTLYLCAGNLVSFLNATTLATIRSVPVGNNPSAIGVDIRTDMVYVANYADDTVSAVNGTAGSDVATIQVGEGPIGVAADYSSDTIYISNQRSDTVSILSGANNKITGSAITGEDPGTPTVDIQDNLVFVPDAGPYPAEISVIANGNSQTFNPEDSISLKISPESVTTGSVFSVFGTVDAASGSVSGSEVHVTIHNPNDTLVASGAAPVSGVSEVGNYTAQFTAGGTQAWIPGYYNVTVTYLTIQGNTPASESGFFTYHSTAPNPGPVIVQATSDDSTNGQCAVSPCSLQFENPVFNGDTVIAALGLECTTTCSSFTFSDSLGTTFNMVLASEKISCSGASGTIYSIFGYGIAQASGADQIEASWAGGLETVSSLDVIEASDAPYLASGVSYGTSGLPSLNSNLTGSAGDIFVGMLAFVSPNTASPVSCDQTAGLTPGWTIWGGVNTDAGLYDVHLTTSDIPFGAFSAPQMNWVEIGAVFGSPTAPLIRTTTLTTTTTVEQTSFITTTLPPETTTVTSSRPITQTFTTTTVMTVTNSEFGLSPLSTNSPTVAFSLGALVAALVSSLAALGFVARKRGRNPREQKRIDQL